MFSAKLLNYRLAVYMLNIFVNIFCCKYKNNKKYEFLYKTSKIHTQYIVYRPKITSIFTKTRLAFR